MSRYRSEQTERDAVRMAALLMAASARTAPKARGVDAIKTLILDGNDLEELASTMEHREELKPYLGFAKDAKSVRNSGCVLLIGVVGNPKKIEQPLDCGACGYESCQRLAEVRKQAKGSSGPTCIFQALDLGIALSSAVKLASELNIDNRIMHTIGDAAKELQLLDSDLIIGIPLSVTGKSPYFDRQ